MHHKRGKPKSRRAGCLMCKYYKHQRLHGGKQRFPIRDRRKTQEDRFGDELESTGE